MPLPLPTLDTRRWADMVEEARALVPRLAPAWTDHNASDPGITLLELLAWLVEQDIYRVDQIPERHRAAFLRLIGVVPEPPQPARVPLAFELKAGETEAVLPAGTVVTASGAGRSVRFATVAGLVVLPAALVAVQRFDGTSFEDVTRLWRDGLPVELTEALLLGFDNPLPAARPFSLWIAVEGGADAEAQRRAIRDERAAQLAAARRLSPAQSCSPAGPPGRCPDPARDNRSVQLAWEYDDGGQWKPLAADDPTRGLTLDGVVRLTAATSAAPAAIGVLSQPLHWVRCRIAEGRPDEPPVLLDVAANVVEAEQRSRVHQALAIAPGTAAPASAPVVGSRRRVDLGLDDADRITSLEFSAPLRGPRGRILGYEPASAAAPGRLAITFALAGRGDGAPGQVLVLPDAPVSRAALGLWTLVGPHWQRWQSVPGFEGRAAEERVFVLDPQRGEVRFGDGEHGQVPPSGGPIVVAYETTAGAGGNVPRASDWTLTGADDELNAALPGDPLQAAARLRAISARRAATTGRDAETVAHAFGRAAEILWAHERLLELAPLPGSSLDGLDRDLVLSRVAPWRAATTLDFERLALAVPGTRVRRARAWAGIDPAYPCLRAPGTVTVVVVPGSPRGRPAPETELLGAVRRFLQRRKTLGTRLVVTGPDYVEVSVDATLRVAAGADPAGVAQLAQATLTTFLDPLHGGPNGRGWPFGRDVYRSELLALLDGVVGVDHVEQLQVDTASGDIGCNDVCVGPAQLVVSGVHSVEALR